MSETDDTGPMQTAPPGSEAGLMEGLLRKNALATEHFVRDNLGWMLAVAKRILSDPALAEDAAQNAFAKVFKHLDGFDGRSSLKTWMHRIVVNEALSMLRKKQRSDGDNIDEMMPVFDENRCRVEDEWATFQTPQSLLERSETKALVRGCIDRLPEDYRIVLTLRDIEELSTSEVADRLGLSEANVKIRLHRARAVLKKLLEPLMRGQES